MARSTMLHVRVDNEIKTQATEALAAMGPSVSDAVRILLRRVVNDQAFPMSGSCLARALHRASCRSRKRAFACGTSAGRARSAGQVAQFGDPGHSTVQGVLAANRKTRPFITQVRCTLRRALCAAALIAGPAFAQEPSELVDLINAYRTAPQTCNGTRAPAAGPLAPDAALASVQVGSGDDVRNALKAHGYLAARALAIRVSGPATASEAMRFVQERYCRSLLSPQYAEIGISRDKDTWHIVLAQPLLASNLGDWREAGKEILRLTNAARAKPRTCGGRRFEAAPPLAWTTKLATAALVHSRDMADRNYFDHRGKDGSHVGGRATREGYVWRRVGENIAAGQGSPEQVVSGWLSSPHHCANIMNPDFSEMGAAFVANPASDNTIYWTQVFGTPR